MKGKMKGKMKGVLLIAVFLLTTLTGITFIPTVSASTPITAEYILTTDGTATADWVADEVYSGSYSVKLTSVSDNNQPSVEITPTSGITFGDLEDGVDNAWTYWYYSPEDDTPWIYFTLRFKDPTSETYIDVVNQQIYTTEDAWTELDLAASDRWQIISSIKLDVVAEHTLEMVYDEIDAEGDPGAVDDWELIMVNAHLYDAQVSSVYIDDITIDDELYEMEPQSLTVGESYSISWTTADSVAVDLDYTPETLVDIDRTETSNTEGVVNFYNVIPTYAMNWKLSDLTGPVDPPFDAPNTPTGSLGINYLMKMIYGNEAVYFSVQPVEDYDIVVSPSSVDVESGTTVLTVTVTSDGEPVEDAYVSVEFWDNEAEEFYTLDTASLREYETQTASNGMAMFDIEVPEVAGTIYVTAGTDLGPEIEESIDGAYFEHWGYTMIPVSAINAIDITVSPTTYMMGIPYNLDITLENAIDDIHVLGASTKDHSVNVTLEGADFGGTIATADLLKIAINEVLADGVEITIDTGVYTIPSGTAELRISGNIVTFAQADSAVITIGDFTASELGVVTVSAGVDIGGVSATRVLDDLSLEEAPDLVFDYTESAVKTITISEPGGINFVGLTPDEIPATQDKTISFTAYYYDGTSTEKATGFDVTLEYPSGITYEGTTDGSTAVFTKTLQSGTEPYWADEAGNMTITVSGTVGEDEYSGTTTIPVTGYLVSTDTETIVVLQNSTVTITVTNSTGGIVNNAKVTLTESAGALTASEMDGSVVEIDGTVTSISDGLYVFHNVNATMVNTITVLVVLGSDSTISMARLEIEASNPVLTVTSTKDVLTNLIDNVFTIRVMNGATAESTAVVSMNVTNTGETTTNSTGHADIIINEDQLASTVDSVRIYVVSSDVGRTGVIVLPVSIPVYQANATFYLTAGMDSYGNFTLKSADSDSAIILADDEIENDAKVSAYANLIIDDTSGEIAVDEEMETDANGYSWFTLTKEKSATTLVKEDYLNITAKTAGGSLTALVESIPIYNPIVSNSTYTGFPVTYTAYVGQSQNFYIKIQDASGAAVEEATVAIIAGVDTVVASGDTNSAGETTITWEPTATGTYDLRLNEVLDIGVITVASYVAPQLAIDYTPTTVYLDDIVTVSVTADGELAAGIPVSIVDPDGITIERTTTGAGTCAFTADKLGEWGMWAYLSEDSYDYIYLEVLERTPTEIPANTTGEETLDSTGAPATDFAQGETVLASAEVSNVGTTSQTMVIVAQLKDPELRVLAPMYITITLAPGQSVTPSIGFLLPTTGYATGTWTATIMVFDAWPAQGGVPIGLPVTMTFEVTS